MSKVRALWEDECEQICQDFQARKVTLADAVDALMKRGWDRDDAESELAAATAGCMRGICRHKSDCAVHNEPAYPAGPCDCGYEQLMKNPQRDPLEMSHWGLLWYPAAILAVVAMYLFEQVG